MFGQRGDNFSLVPGTVQLRRSEAASAKRKQQPPQQQPQGWTQSTQAGGAQSYPKREAKTFGKGRSDNRNGHSYDVDAELRLRRNRLLAEPPNKRVSLVNRKPLRKDVDDWGQVIRIQEEREKVKETIALQKSCMRKKQYISELDQQVAERERMRQAHVIQQKQDLQRAKDLRRKYEQDEFRKRQEKMQKSRQIIDELTQFEQYKTSQKRRAFQQQRAAELSYLQEAREKDRRYQQRDAERRQREKERFAQLVEANYAQTKQRQLDEQRRREEDERIMQEYYRMEEIKEMRRRKEMEGFQRSALFEAKAQEDAETRKAKKLEEERRFLREVEARERMQEDRLRRREMRARQAAIDAVSQNDQLTRLKHRTKDEEKRKQFAQRMQMEDRLRRENEQHHNRMVQKRMHRLQYGKELKRQMESDLQRPRDPSWIMSDYEKKVNSPKSSENLFIFKDIDHTRRHLAGRTSNNNRNVSPTFQSAAKSMAYH